MKIPKDAYNEKQLAALAKIILMMKYAVLKIKSAIWSWTMRVLLILTASGIFGKV